MKLLERCPIEDLAAIARSLQHEIRNVLQMILVDLECAEAGELAPFQSLEELHLHRDQLRLALKESEIILQRIKRESDESQLLYDIEFLWRVVKFFERHMKSNRELFETWIESLRIWKRELKDREEHRLVAW